MTARPLLDIYWKPGFVVWHLRPHMKGCCARFRPPLLASCRCAGLLGEGAVQVLYSTDEYITDPVLAAVGQLQFEVVQYRLKASTMYCGTVLQRAAPPCLGQAEG